MVVNKKAVPPKKAVAVPVRRKAVPPKKEPSRAKKDVRHARLLHRPSDGGYWSYASPLLFPPLGGRVIAPPWPSRAAANEAAVLADRLPLLFAPEEAVGASDSASVWYLDAKNLGAPPGGGRTRPGRRSFPRPSRPLAHPAAREGVEVPPHVLSSPSSPSASVVRLLAAARGASSPGRAHLALAHGQCWWTKLLAEMTCPPRQ